MSKLHDKILQTLPRMSVATMRLNGMVPAITGATGITIATTDHPLRQQTKDTRSKLHIAFMEHLQAIHRPPALVIEEALTFSIANGCTYRPDMCVITTHRPPGAPMDLLHLAAYEVKGRWGKNWGTDDAKVKIKVAAAVYPWIRWYFVIRPERAGPWQIHPVEPLQNALYKRK